MSELSLLRGRGRLGAARVRRQRRRTADRERLSTMAAALRFNNLKIAASEQAPRVCQGALGVCGIVGFKNDTPFSVGRHLRDTMSALPDGRERAHPPDEREPAADRQGGLTRVAEFRQPTADQAELLDELVEAGLLVASGVPGVYGRGRGLRATCARRSTTSSRATSRPTTAPSALRFPPRPAAPPARGRRLPEVLPAPRRHHLRLRGQRGRGGRAAGARAARHEDWSEFQQMTDLVLMPAACYPVYPAIAARGPLPAGGVIVDAGRRLRLPPRAVGRPGAAADVPPCARSSGSASPRRSSAWRDGWRDRARRAAARRSASTPTSTSPATRSSAAPGGCSPRASASRS